YEQAASAFRAAMRFLKGVPAEARTHLSTAHATAQLGPGLRRDTAKNLARQFPAEPVADRATHHQFEVAALQPWHLFGEHRDALLPRAGHAGDIGAPEATLRPEGLDDLLRVFVDVPVGVRLARIAGRSGAFDRDIGVFGERQ